MHKDLCQHRENVEEKGIRLSLVYSVKCCGTWQSLSENGWREGVRHNGVTRKGLGPRWACPAQSGMCGFLALCREVFII